METKTSRRYFMLGSTVALGQFSLLRHVAANTLATGAAVPTIDSLSIKVVIDSSHDIFLRPRGRRR